MKKGVFRRRGARREEGMALLFALGFLALMLILGLGFVTTSMLAQKLAANNSSRAQARMFARSAAARAMLGIMLYNDQAALSGKNIENYDSICSYDKVACNNNGTKHPNEDKVDFSDSGFREKIANDPAALLSDQLHKSSDDAVDESKLKYTVGTEDYTGENSSAKWMYFYDSREDVDGRRIIGRAAFQVLPRQAGRLSLYGITGGSKVKSDYGAYPHTYRWGRDIAELNLEHTQTLPNWYASVGDIPFKYETMYTTYGNFFTTSPDVKKKWLEYWFAEGKNPILKDAFPKLDPSDNSGRKVIYINRFNISHYFTSDEGGSGKDNWYERFRMTGHRNKGWNVSDEELAAKKNSDAALEALTQDAEPYKENHTTDPEVNPSGLPFLKRIGNDPWSFESLELLRKQIAANFNDYCDEDSIPTSDVKASEWSVTGSTFPTYTGNEKTLYINEAAFELAPVQVTYDQNNYALQIKKDQVKFKLWIELINMYDNSDSPQLLNPANLEAVTGVKKLTFKFTLEGKYSGNVRYTTSNGRSGTATFETNVVSADATISFDGKDSVTVAGDKFSALANGYSVGSGELTLTVTNPETSVFTNAVKNAAQQAANKKAGESVTITKITIRDVAVGCQLKTTDKLELAPVLLRANKDITDGGKTVCAKNTGVDFVRFDRAGAMAFVGMPSKVETNLNTKSGWTPKIYESFFIGGLEARDPRQNLNPDPANAKKSDWNLAPQIVPADDMNDAAPSMTVESEKTSVDSVEVTKYKIAGGKINRNVDPSAPKYMKDSSAVGLAASEFDKETATDPAWRGGEHGEHVSTAYIRNAPMVSPWEIGLIHRGREWQTLNLKRAGGFGSAVEVKIADIDSGYGNWTDKGTTYQNGDGAILEFVKTGIDCRCMGKVPLTLLRSEVIKEKNKSGGNNSDWNGVAESYNRDIIKMLFDGIRLGQTMKQFYAETKLDAPSEQGGDKKSVESSVIDRMIEEIDDMYNGEGSSDGNGNKVFRMRSQFLNSDYGAVGGADNPTSFSFGLAKADNDALREELIGKTVNLLTVNEETPPNIFRVIVVAQSIRDVGGIGTDVSLSKIHKGKSEALDCQIGRFDFIGDSANWENNTYFDEITGEVKALVTIERVPATDDAGNKNKDYGRMVVTGIEFID